MHPAQRVDSQPAAEGHLQVSTVGCILKMFPQRPCPSRRIHRLRPPKRFPALRSLRYRLHTAASPAFIFMPMSAQGVTLANASAPVIDPALSQADSGAVPAIDPGASQQVSGDGSMSDPAESDVEDKESDSEASVASPRKGKRGPRISAGNAMYGHVEGSMKGNKRMGERIYLGRVLVIDPAIAVYRRKALPALHKRPGKRFNQVMPDILARVSPTSWFCPLA